MKHAAALKLVIIALCVGLTLPKAMASVLCSQLLVKSSFTRVQLDNFLRELSQMKFQLDMAQVAGESDPALHALAVDYANMKKDLLEKSQMDPATLQNELQKRISELQKDSKEIQTHQQVAREQNYVFPKWQETQSLTGKLVMHKVVSAKANLMLFTEKLDSGLVVRDLTSGVEKNLYIAVEQMWKAEKSDSVLIQDRDNKNRLLRYDLATRELKEWTPRLPEDFPTLKDGVELTFSPDERQVLIYNIDSDTLHYALVDVVSGKTLAANSIKNDHYTEVLVMDDKRAIIRGEYSLTVFNMRTRKKERTEVNGLLGQSHTYLATDNSAVFVLNNEALTRFDIATKDVQVRRMPSTSSLIAIDKDSLWISYKAALSDQSHTAKLDPKDLSDQTDFEKFYGLAAHDTIKYISDDFVVMASRFRQHLTPEGVFFRNSVASGPVFDFNGKYETNLQIKNITVSPDGKRMVVESAAKNANGQESLFIDTWEGITHE